MLKLALPITDPSSGIDKKYTTLDVCSIFTRSVDMAAFGIDIIIADDHPAVLLGVIASLGDAPSIRVQGCASNSTQIAQLLELHDCSVLVSDYSMPGGAYGDGSSMLSALKRRYPKLGIVVMTSVNSSLVLRSLLSQGVRCIVSKSDDLSHLAPAIHAAYSGGSHFSTTVARVLSEINAETASFDRVPVLTDREVEVVRLFVGGMSVNEIAAHLHRSKQTISSQKNSAMRKLNTERDGDLFKYAVEVGLVTTGGLDQ
ncbi:response regulator transcription factor [Iodobacter sp. LRB]|uniref:response regulator transcription factor n=1 Tax=unclassified Iodobacter TaxID=235634 RepID=UPI00211E167B|nr:response regulator transcription factor [Iodobacter sp. BJB302]